ncbi:MAG: DNA repair protein RadC [Chloroflexi bacterium]|nr:DNA repair protein RadC [Chloroflexota bacterium]
MSQVPGQQPDAAETSAAGEARSSAGLQTGHRRRLREKFLKSGLASFHDYEIVELLLSLGTPRRDCKAAAKEAIRRFKTLRGVMEASPRELQEIDGIGPHNAFGIKLVHEVAREFLKSRILDRPVLQSSQEVFDYLYHSMRDLKREVFKVIYLDAQNQIIDVEDLFQGSVNSSSVSIRDVVSRAISNSAVAVVGVHNHPSGSPEPSSQDRELTRELVYAGKVMRIKVLDHIVIGDNRFFSFAGEGLIEEYEIDYLNMKVRGTAEAKRRLYRARQSPGPSQ